MAIKTYIPTKLSAELDRFKTNLGNIKIDYRNATGSAPYLLSTPLTFTDLTEFNTPFTCFPSTVPEGAHITGDQSNYRRYSVDLAMISDDHQRNAVYLQVDGQIIKVSYKDTIYLEEQVPSEPVVKTLHHRFLIDEVEFVETNYTDYNHLSLNYEEADSTGFVDSEKIVKITLNTSLSFDGIYYEQELDTGVGNKGFIAKETTTTTYGVSGSVVDPTLIPEELKDLKYIKGFVGADRSFKTNSIYASRFSSDGSNLSTENTNVLTDNLPNFYLYSKSQNYDQNIIGYSVNISPTRGALLHNVVESDNRSYLTTDSDLIGVAYSYLGTEYTGLLSSPFLLLKLDLTSTDDVFKIKINNNAEVLVGDYSSITFDHLCAKLSELLYPHGILVIPCKNNIVGFDRYQGTGKVEIVLSAATTVITTLPQFTSFEYLHSTKTITYDPTIHPVNYSFTYIDDTNSTPDYPNIYKLNIDEDTGRLTNYTTYRVRLAFDIPSVRNTTQTFKLEVEEGVLDTTFTINTTDTLNTILDSIATAIDTFLPSNYSIFKNYLTYTLDIINNEPTDSAYAKITTGSWVSVDSKFGGSYVKDVNGTKGIVLKPNDGSLTVISDTGIIAIDSSYSTLHGYGVTSLNPMTGQFTTMINDEYPSTGFDYCATIAILNYKYRQYGYEAIPLYNGSTSTVSPYIGVTRIVSGTSQIRIATYSDDRANAIVEDFCKSAINMYHTDPATGLRAQISKNNASLELWENKLIARSGVSDPNKQGRPFTIDEITTTAYSRTITGTIANRDSISTSSIMSKNATTSTLKTTTLNPVSNPAETCSNLVDLLTYDITGQTKIDSVVGDVYHCENSWVKVSLNSVTFELTLTYTDQENYSICSAIGFDQASDFAFANYAGWVPYTYGINGASFGALESKSYIRLLVTTYHDSVDGV